VLSCGKNLSPGFTGGRAPLQPCRKFHSCKFRHNPHLLPRTLPIDCCHPEWAFRSRGILRLHPLPCRNRDRSLPRLHDPSRALCGRACPGPPKGWILIFGMNCRQVESESPPKQSLDGATLESEVGPPAQGLYCEYPDSSLEFTLWLIFPKSSGTQV
jgi:hypothetical protein